MAFSANDRVLVTSQASPYRGKYGTVLVAAAANPHNLNEVRLDGFRDGVVVLLRDEELRATNFESPISY